MGQGNEIDDIDFVDIPEYDGDDVDECFGLVVGGFTENEFLEWEKRMEVVETDFSLAPASRIKRSELPASAFLIVGDGNVKATWHMPYKDETGKVNVGLLRAARQVVKNREFRGRRITFRIPADVVAKVNRLWDEWQRKKEMATSFTHDEIRNIESIEFEYLSEGEGDSMALADRIRGKDGRARNCDMLVMVDDCFEGVMFDDDSKVIKGAAIMTEGWSRNDHGYPESYLDSLVSRLKERPKMFIGHVIPKDKDDIPSKLKRMDRPLTEWAATVMNPRKERSKSGKFKGRNQVRADLEFTEMDVGEQTYRQAKKDPSSVRISINARNRYRKGTFEGVKGMVMEECLFLYSPDFVAYDAAGGGVDVSASDLAGLSAWEKTIALGEGIYYESGAEDVGDVDEFARGTAQKTKMAVKYRKATSGSEDTCANCRFFLASYVYKDGHEIVDLSVPGQCTLVEGQVEPSFVSDLFEKKGEPVVEEIQNKMNNDSNKSNEQAKGKEVSKMSRFEFENVEEALKNPDILKAITGVVPDFEVKNPVDGKLIKVKDLIVSFENLTKERNELKTKNDEYEQAAKKIEKEKLFNLLVSSKKHNIPERFVSEEFRNDCLAVESDEEMEKKIISQKEMIAAVANEVVKSHSADDSGGKSKSEERSYFESLIDNNKNGKDKKQTDEEFWSRYQVA